MGFVKIPGMDELPRWTEILRLLTDGGRDLELALFGVLGCRCVGRNVDCKAVRDEDGKTLRRSHQQDRSRP